MKLPLDCISGVFRKGEFITQDGFLFVITKVKDPHNLTIKDYISPRYRGLLI